MVRWGVVRTLIEGKKADIKIMVKKTYDLMDRDDEKEIERNTYICVRVLLFSIGKADGGFPSGSTLWKTLLLAIQSAGAKS